MGSVTKLAVTVFFPVPANRPTTEFACFCSFWAVRVRNVFDEHRMLVLDGDDVGKIKVDFENFFGP